MDTRLFIQGGTGLVQQQDGVADCASDWIPADVTLYGARIDYVGGSVKSGTEGTVFDAQGLLLLPGIVDLHGDAFERQIQRHHHRLPRPGL